MKLTYPSFLAVVFALLYLKTAAEMKLSPYCQLNLGLGALTALSKQKFSDITQTLNRCPDLIESTKEVFIMDISFTKDISDPFAMLNNIREIQKIVNSIRPALDQCSTS